MTADVLNTINGGMSLAFVEKVRKEDHIFVTVKVPGVREDALKVEMREDKLLVFHQIQIDTETKVPNLVAILPLSSLIDLNNIQASFEKDRLNIILPFNDLHNELPRKVDIK